MEAPGKGLLKVVSVVYILFGAIMTLLVILALFGINVIFPAATTTGAEILGILDLGGILFMIAVVLELIMGIVGYRRSDEPSHSSFFITIGVILGIVALISMIVRFTVWSLIGFILPVLYIIGGAMNRRVASGGRL